MGNTPTQQPYEGDSPSGEDSPAGASLRETVVGYVRGALAGLRRRVSVFPSLELGSAFSVSEADVAESRRLRTPDADESDGQGQSLASIPDRDLPLVEPARDTGQENAPDLEATEDEDGRLAIYYPDSADARITSDTWETVEP
ncbi:hypothetical protein [Halorientalis halophila]|uniref:hypothetical protein n=1 Tax=Halorientalis halophila TaxID=3108499 RepID=UPI003009FC88